MMCRETADKVQEATDRLYQRRQLEVWAENYTIRMMSARRDGWDEVQLREPESNQKEGACRDSKKVKRDSL